MIFRVEGWWVREVLLDVPTMPMDVELGIHHLIRPFSHLPPMCSWLHLTISRWFSMESAGCWSSGMEPLPPKLYSIQGRFHLKTRIFGWPLAFQATQMANSPWFTNTSLSRPTTVPIPHPTDTTSTTTTSAGTTATAASDSTPTHRDIANSAIPHAISASPQLPPALPATTARTGCWITVPVPAMWGEDSTMTGPVWCVLVATTHAKHVLVVMLGIAWVVSLQTTGLWT